MSWIFWASAFLIFYTYAGYPLLLWLASRIFYRPARKGPVEPTVSIILSAFNEEKHIEKKLLNLLNLDYPEDKLEILVGSDGAFDKTDDIISKFHSPRIRLFRFVTNLGKPHVLNSLVQEEAVGQIIVFTDARQQLARDAIRRLVENFNDPKVGCVSGELCFEEVGRESIGLGVDLYWRYEKFLRKRESEMGSMLGATGAIYAIQRSLFSAVPADILVDDMFIPFSILSKGYRAVFEPQALAYDRVSSKGKEEFKRKIRTLAGNCQIFHAFPGFFNIFRSPIAWQLFSHKFLRLAVPFLQGGLFLANAALTAIPFYRVTFLLQCLFYILAGIEAFQDRGQQREQRKPAKRRIGYIPYTFCLLNYSALIGLLQFLTKKQKGAWEKAYV